MANQQAANQQADQQLIEYLHWIMQMIERAAIARNLVSNADLHEYVQRTYDRFKLELLRLPITTTTDRIIVENWLIRAQWPVNKIERGLTIQDFYYATESNDRIYYTAAQLQQIGQRSYQSGYQDGQLTAQRTGVKTTTPEEREAIRNDLLTKTFGEKLKAEAQVSEQREEINRLNRRIRDLEQQLEQTESQIWMEEHITKEYEEMI